jgi:hypothetical protein
MLARRVFEVYRCDDALDLKSITIRECRER